MAWWCNGQSVGLATERLWVQLPAVLLSGNDLRQVCHTHVPLFTKQYKLVPAKGPVAGRVTVGIAESTDSRSALVYVTNVTRGLSA